MLGRGGSGEIHQAEKVEVVSFQVDGSLCAKAQRPACPRLMNAAYLNPV